MSLAWLGSDLFLPVVESASNQTDMDGSNRVVLGC